MVSFSLEQGKTSSIWDWWSSFISMHCPVLAHLTTTYFPADWVGWACCGGHTECVEGMFRGRSKTAHFCVICCCCHEPKLAKEQTHGWELLDWHRLLHDDTGTYKLSKNTQESATPYGTQNSPSFSQLAYTSMQSGRTLKNS